MSNTAGRVNILLVSLIVALLTIMLSSVLGAHTTNAVHAPAIQKYSLKMVVSPTNSGVLSPGSGSYVANSIVTISATPTGKYLFKSWSGSGPGSYSGTANPVNIVMHGNINEKANFYSTTTTTITTTSTTSTTTKSTTSTTSISTTTVPQYFLTMISYPQNSAILSPGSGYHAANSIVAISAIPEGNYVFLNWTGSGIGSYSGSGNPANITMSANVTEQANFYYYTSTTTTTTTTTSTTTTAP